MRDHGFGTAALAALIAITFGCPGDAQESTFTVGKLQRLCDGYFKFPRDPDAAGPCGYYVLGITDGFLHAGYMGRSICPPSSARLPTLINTIFDDFHTDPPPQDGQAPTFVYRALMRAYPCKR
jgi:hypothetical protein